MGSWRGWMLFMRMVWEARLLDDDDGPRGSSGAMGKLELGVFYLGRGGNQ